MGYFPLIWKGSITHMHGLAVYIREGFPFAWDLFLGSSMDSYLCFQLALFHSVSYLLSSINHLLCLYTWVLILFHLTDEVLLINSSANMFVFGEFNFHHNNCLTYSGRTDRPGGLCYNISISNDLTLMANFPTGTTDYDYHGPVLLDLFLSFDASISSTKAFPPLGNTDDVVVSVYIDFPSY